MEIKIDIENVETVRLFGSHARGEESQYSDYDVLVVLKKSQRITSSLKSKIDGIFEREISISWYSKERIEYLFKMGHLFAWHLFMESIKLYCERDFIDDLVPVKYKFAREDIWSLMEILEPIKEAVSNAPENIVFETGLVYVCARNIAIAALPELKNEYSFSVYAPFRVGLDISRQSYIAMMACRHSSSRGLPAPHIKICEFNLLYESILAWGNKLSKSVNTK